MKLIQHNSPMGELIVHTLGGKYVEPGVPVEATDEQAANLFLQARDNWTEVGAPSAPAETPKPRKPRVRKPKPAPIPAADVNEKES